MMVYGFFAASGLSCLALIDAYMSFRLLFGKKKNP